MLEEKMRLQAGKTERLMEHLAWSPRLFADAIDVEITEAYKLLGGEAVNYYTAKQFIDYFKAPFAAALVDYAALGIEPPDFVRPHTDETELFAAIARSIKGKAGK